MKYKIKRLAMGKLARKDEIELPDGTIILEAKSSTTLVSHGENYKVWEIHYLEPLIEEGK